jgi:hypothetical protein
VLTDLGYGKIASVKTNDFDSNPAGCNCLVVEEAFPNATTIVNYSQFDGVSGSVTAIAFQGSDQSTPHKYKTFNRSLMDLAQITPPCFSTAANLTAVNEKMVG